MPYYADRYIEGLLNTYSSLDWREAVGDEQPGGGDSHSIEQPSQASLQIQVPWLKARSFIQYVLGWSYADNPDKMPASNLQLHRILPVSHPRYGWLCASSVTWNGLAPVAVAGIGSKVAGAYSTSLPVAKYQLLMATVQFTDHPWLYLTDSDVNGGPTSFFEEVNRYTYFDPAPSVQIISAEGLNNVAFGNGPQRGKAVPAPFGTLMAVTTKTYNWMQVPHEFISSGNGFIVNSQFVPTKIDACVGRVNSTEFLGNPAGTLLLQAPQYERFRFPVQTAVGVFGYFGWNIKFPMQFFDPDRGGDIGRLSMRAGDEDGAITVPPFLGAGTLPPVGMYVAGDTVDLSWVDGTGKARYGVDIFSVTDVIVGGIVVARRIVIENGVGDILPVAGTDINVISNRFRGHQLVPSRFDLKWYAALRQDGTSKLYPEANFNTMFSHVSS